MQPRPWTGTTSPVLPSGRVFIALGASMVGCRVDWAGANMCTHLKTYHAIDSIMKMFWNAEGGRPRPMDPTGSPERI